MDSQNNNISGIDDQAAKWVMKMDRGLSAREQDAFSEWMGQSQKHRDAYAAHRFAWSELARLAGLQNTDYAPVVPDLLGVDGHPWYRKIVNSPKWAVAMSVAATLTFLAGYVIMNQLRDQIPPLAAAQFTVVNQIQQHQLEDGSIVDLNKGAEIETLFSRETRLVKLLSGEANFNVEKDPSRPFIVEAAGVRVRAVGTVFNVRIADQKVDVVVTEGTVVLQAPMTDDTAGNPVEQSLIRRNFRAVVDLQSETPRISVNPVSDMDLDSELLWQPQLIDFEDAPLSRIVDEFNRRNPIQIEIQDQEIASLRFTSIFWSHNVESFVRLLESNYGIEAEMAAENRIVLKKAPIAL